MPVDWPLELYADSVFWYGIQASMFEVKSFNPKFGEKCCASVRLWVLPLSVHTATIDMLYRSCRDRRREHARTEALMFEVKSFNPFLPRYTFGARFDCSHSYLPQ